VIAIGLDQLASGSHAIQLLDQHAAFAAATQGQFANQLLISSALAGGTFNTAEEFAVCHPGLVSCKESQCARKVMSLLILMGQPPRNS
jgi:hypothetical protein